MNMCALKMFLPLMSDNSIKLPKIYLNHLRCYFISQWLFYQFSHAGKIELTHYLHRF